MPAIFHLLQVPSAAAEITISDVYSLPPSSLFSSSSTTTTAAANTAASLSSSSLPSASTSPTATAPARTNQKSTLHNQPVPLFDLTAAKPITVVPSLPYDQHHQKAHSHNSQQQTPPPPPLLPQQRQNGLQNHLQQVSLGHFEAVTATLTSQLPSALAIISVLLVVWWLVCKFKTRRPPSSSSLPSTSPSSRPCSPSTISITKSSLSLSPFSSPSITTYTTKPNSLSTRYLSQPSYQSLDFRTLSPQLETQQLLNHQSLQRHFVNSTLLNNPSYYFSVPPPPLTPPEVSESIFTLGTRTSETEFIHQPNPDYLSDTDAEDFINAKMSDSEQTSVKSAVPIKASVGSGHAHGEVIQGQIMNGQQWTRHTVVYNNGPCSCCVSKRGGSYGPSVTPAEKRQ
ncbi:uncharacterized protein BROUX77_003663 [Berkeleyomyces rouxiae]|uniref:uncharacterized protein n=1 Tax=Berkeleyomyces rouxiae TaxID=2035830 RepID=UPI003B7DFEF8